MTTFWPFFGFETSIQRWKYRPKRTSKKLNGYVAEKSTVFTTSLPNFKIACWKWALSVLQNCVRFFGQGSVRAFQRRQKMFDIRPVSRSVAEVLHRGLTRMKRVRGLLGKNAGIRGIKKRQNSSCLCPQGNLGFGAKTRLWGHQWRLWKKEVKPGRLSLVARVLGSFGAKKEPTSFVAHRKHLLRAPTVHKMWKTHRKWAWFERKKLKNQGPFRPKSKSDLAYFSGKELSCHKMSVVISIFKKWPKSGASRRYRFCINFEIFTQKTRAILG